MAPQTPTGTPQQRQATPASSSGYDAQISELQDHVLQLEAQVIE